MNRQACRKELQKAKSDEINGLPKWVDISEKNTGPVEPQRLLKMWKSKWVDMARRMGMR